MDDKLFLIAIGGTGMRCLESFVHLCAAGMFDNKEIDILTLDTDQSNGNKGRVENLIDLYNKVKTDDAGDKIGGTPRSNTFFSAKLNLYKFFTDYSPASRKTYELLSQNDAADKAQAQDNKDLSDLFFDRDSVQQFDLGHGYRAQTHLGSMLMYHGIVEAARNAKRGHNVKPQEKALQDFVTLLNKNAGAARVFVFGSIFGGTGASSIPVIPIALRDALKIITDGANEIDLDKVKFGSTLLTDYFTFNPPTQKQRQHDKVIADSNNFALNSQAALAFYADDPTVSRFYKRLYHVGWPTQLKADWSSKDGGKVLTGGAEQTNPCHVAELVCASAAYDFFTRESFSNKKAEYLFRSVPTDGPDVLRLTGASFAGEKDGYHLENKLCALFSLAHLVLSSFSGTADLITNLSRNKVNGFETLTPQQCKQLDDYFFKMAYAFQGEELQKGWIYQLKDSVKTGTFIFGREAFHTKRSELKNVDYGKLSTDDKHHWETSWFGDSFDTLTKYLKKPTTDAVTNTQGNTTKEQFLGKLYNAITVAENYNSKP